MRKDIHRSAYAPLSLRNGRIQADSCAEHSLTPKKNDIARTRAQATSPTMFL